MRGTILSKKLLSAAAALMLATGLLVAGATSSSATANVKCSSVKIYNDGTQWRSVYPAASGSTDCYLAQGNPYPRAVKALQRSLVYCNYQSLGSIDGLFGAKTRAAVWSFQSDFGLATDGVYGNNTRNKMWFWSNEDDGWGFCN
ncbi:peptidoglycan-binding domain-containing protein [Cellulomonas sp. URHB0016]